MKHRLQRFLDRAPVRPGRHQVGHVRPPATHHVRFGELRDPVIGRPFEHGEQVMGVVVEKDPVVRDTRRAKRVGEFRPDRIVPAPVFVPLDGVQVHPHGDRFHGHASRFHCRFTYMPPSTSSAAPVT